MKVFLGSNEINDCEAALVVNGEEVFRFRERESDGRMVCDFDVRDKDGNRLAKISKNNVVHVAPGFVVEHQPRVSNIKNSDGEIIACVEEIAIDIIKVQGSFCINGHTVVINSETLISGGVTMAGNKISGYKKAIAIEPNSFAIGSR